MSLKFESEFTKDQKDSLLERFLVKADTEEFDGLAILQAEVPPEV